MPYDTPLDPPAEWFSPPDDGIPTDRRISIEQNGRVYGYIALWDTCHAGIGGCVRPPKGSPTDYEYAHQGETMTAGGEIIRTAVIGGGAGHAPMDAENPVEFYENSGTQLMRVRYGEDSEGLWFAGALWPDVNELDVARIRASSLSGDWRWHAAWRHTQSGGYDFAGACLVNIPGFPMPADGHIGAKAGRLQSIAASSYVPFDGEGIVFDGKSFMLSHVAASALPFVATPKADPGTAWDGPASVAGVSGKDQLRKIHAWVDPDGDPESKSSYKLPHHTPDGRVVLRGVQAAMAALMGARGGVDIPESDRQGVYNHLAKHYEQFGEEPPELTASITGEETVACNGNPEECGCTPETCTASAAPAEEETPDDGVEAAEEPAAEEEKPKKKKKGKKKSGDGEATKPAITYQDFTAALERLTEERRLAIMADVYEEAAGAEYRSFEEVQAEHQHLLARVRAIETAVEGLLVNLLVERSVGDSASA